MYGLLPWECTAVYGEEGWNLQDFTLLWVRIDLGAQFRDFRVGERVGDTTVSRTCGR